MRPCGVTGGMGAIRVRFDDRLKTVLAARHSPGLGAQATWRQLVDLMGRERFADEPALIAGLRDLRAQVPVEVRIASARALAGAWPSAALVGLFGEDEAAVAAPVLRAARLPAAGTCPSRPASDGRHSNGWSRPGAHRGTGVHRPTGQARR